MFIIIESEDEDAEHQSNKKSGVARSATSPSRRARAKSDKNCELIFIRKIKFLILIKLCL